MLINLKKQKVSTIQTDSFCCAMLLPADLSSIVRFLITQTTEKSV